MTFSKLLLSALFAILVGSGFAADFIVDGQSPAGSDANPGTLERPFRTINAAAAKAGPGDRVLVHPGLYREHINPPAGGRADAPVVFESAVPHQAVVRGSELWNPGWQPVDGHPGLYRTPVPADEFFGAFPNPFKRRIAITSGSKPLKPLRGGAEPEALAPYSLGQLFYENVELTQSQREEEVVRVPGSWMVSADGAMLLAHFPGGDAPKRDALEISVRDRIFSPDARGLGYITVRGFVFEHAANQGPFPQQGMVSTRSGHHWIIENNIIRHAKTIGLDCGSEFWTGSAIPRTAPAQQRLIVANHHRIIGNRFSDNGLCGVAGWNHANVKITGNIFERNNSLSFSLFEGQWEEWGAIKLHGAKNALIEGNLIRDNGAHGIWIDNGFVNARITRNVVESATGSGIFLEMGASGRCLIDHNIVANTRPFNLFFDGIGIYGHDAMDLVIAHNTLMGNAAAAVRLTRVTARKFAGEVLMCSRNTIVNNLLLNNGGAIELPPPGEFSSGNTVGHNLIVGDALYRFPGEFFHGQNSDAATVPASTAVFSPKEWQEATAYDRTSVYLPTLFEQGRYLRSMFYGFLKPYEPSIRFELRDGAFAKMECPPVAGITSDFTGAPLRPPVRPGAFQNLQPGLNYFILHPIPMENAK